MAIGAEPAADDRIGSLDAPGAATLPGWANARYPEPVSDLHLPAALRRGDDRRALFEDIEPYLGTTVEERSAIVSDLCRFAVDCLASHPEGSRLLDWQDPRSAASEELWRRLVAAARRA